MRILHVLAQMPAKTGSGVYFSNLIRHLKTFGHQQAAIFACQDDTPFTLLEPSQQYPVHFQCDNLPFPIAGMSDAMPYPSTKYSEMDEQQLNCWVAAFQQRLEDAKTTFAPDAVILHHLWMLSSLGAAVFCDKITVGICHNTDLRQAKQNPALAKRFVTNIGRLNSIFSLSDAQKQDIAALYGYDVTKITTVGGGFDEAIFHPPAHKQPSKTVRLVYAAKIDASKGIYALVTAFNKACDTNPNLHLDIIGTPNAENAPLLHKSAGRNPRIQLMDALPQHQLADHLRQQDVFVLPSFYEGIALMAIESLACGLRVVASEIEPLMALLGDAVNQSGVIEYVPLPTMQRIDSPHPAALPAFIDQLAKALLLQAGRTEQATPFPMEIAQEINHYSWNQLAAKINTVITALVTSPH